MTEYKVMAYFKEVYLSRSFKRKVVDDIETAHKLLKEAKEYYTSFSGSKYLDRVVLVKREVSEWEEVNEGTI